MQMYVEPQRDKKLSGAIRCIKIKFNLDTPNFSKCQNFNLDTLISLSARILAIRKIRGIQIKFNLDTLDSQILM